MEKLEKLCIKWLNDNYNNLELFFIEKYPHYVFHMQNRNCILQYNKKNGVVYINYNEIWSFFESYFGMEYQEIQHITKIWVEEHYKMGVTTIGSNPPDVTKLVEEHYKMGVTTTNSACYRNLLWVEEHYKMGVTTTSFSEGIDYSKVEGQYQNEITTIN